MIDTSQFILFTGASWMLILTPGPDTLFVLSRGIGRGRLAGVVSALGIVCGLLVHTLFATLGLSVILKTSSAAFFIVKSVGAVYLVYLGILAFRRADPLNVRDEGAASSSGTLFVQGMLTNVLNPKVALFFLAFLPQFVEKGRPSPSIQILALGMVFAIYGAFYLVLLGYWSGRIGHVLVKRPGMVTGIRRLAGGLLVVLGLRLALSPHR